MLLLGGARSGKSELALQILGGGRGRRAFIATAGSRDGEMAERILQHRRRRGSTWETVEATVDLPGTLTRLSPTHPVLLVDCLTLWLSNLLFRYRSDGPVLDRIDRLIDGIRQVRGRLVLVSNEVGLGVVPAHRLGRRFRDLSGILHQEAASAVDEVYFVMAGLPLRLKRDARPTPSQRKMRRTSRRRRSS